MAKTLAQQYWSDFERLAFEVTRQCFGITPTRVFRTQESKDGGFDAAFVHELGKLKEVVIRHEVLMEAKLRSGPERVGLRAFAATMIVAFNGQTQCLVVISNREFSPQALGAARDFQWKSRLQVILVGQRTLSAWIRPQLKKLSERFPEPLLRELVLTDPVAEEFIEEEIPEGEGAGVEPRAHIASGRRSDGTLAPCEIRFAERTTGSVPTRVVGKTRQQTVTELVGALSGGGGCAVLVGDAGVGKSHLVLAALAQLPADCRCLGLIDLSQIYTSRQLFLATLAQVTGIEVGDLARQFSSADAKQVFATVNGAAVPEIVTDAVVSVLNSPLTDSRASMIDQTHLNSYLSFIAERAGLGQRVLVFHNLNKTTDEVLEYLHSSLSPLTTKGISVLLELTTGGDAPVVAPSRWQAYMALFERVATLGCFTAPQMTVDNAVELLLEHMEGLGRDRARFICERVGTRPLFLQHAALWLKKRRIVEERAHGSHVIEDAEIFFEGLRPDACMSILDRHIDLWRRDLDLPYADAITAATLLNGRLCLPAVQALIGTTSQAETLADKLVATGLFASEMRLAGIRVSHSLLLERMIAIESGQIAGYGAQPFGRARVARILLSILDRLTDRVLVRELYRSALLEACEEWPEAWDSAERAGCALHQEHQLAAAAEAFSRCVNVAQTMCALGDARGLEWRIQGLIHLLQVEDERYRLGLSENIQRLNVLSVAVRTTSLPPDRATKMLLQTKYLQWRVSFTRERFKEALPIARELFATVSNRPGTEPELAGHAVAALGITLKAVEQTEESKLIFDQGVSAFPQSATCRLERWSNLAALALRAKPHQSLGYLHQILEDVGDRISLLDRIHTEVDLAMAHFLARQRAMAAAQAERSIVLADANAIPAQSARARNILACVRWCEEDLDDAMALLDRAILDAERSYMDRFLWRFRVNLASVATEAGNLSLALASARWAEDRLIAARESQWQDIARTPSHITSRWYVALLTIGLAYDRCGAPKDGERLRLRVASLPLFERHLKGVLTGKFPAAIFRATTHRHANRIMITG